MKVATSINQFLTDKMKPKWHLYDVIRENYVVKWVDALFKQIARDSEYFDRGAAVLAAKINEYQFHRRKRTKWRLY